MAGGARLGDLWDFGDPVASEERFRQAADAAPEEALRQQALTQVARALGLQARFAEAHAVLDGLSGADPETVVRTELERGRLLRSSGDPGAALPRFEQAAARARAAGLDALLVDALHMRALVLAPREQAAATREALTVARASQDRDARAWEASLLNNLGMVRADAGDVEQALALFQEALAARRRGGSPEAVRAARWMVGWALRRLGRRAEALTVQTELRGELEAAGADTTYVDRELALLTGQPGAG